MDGTLKICWNSYVDFVGNNSFGALPGGAQAIWCSSAGSFSIFTVIVCSLCKRSTDYRKLLNTNGIIMRFVMLSIFCLSVSGFLSGQGCMPSPEPALFLEDFGSGSNPGPALTQGTTTYTYGSINTGGYVVSNTTNLNPNFWHNALDHTQGDTDGYMLIFNASEGPGTFYQKTFMELCPNTNYIFSCHIANVAVPTACIGDSEKPNVEFSVIDPRFSIVQFSATTDEIFYSSRLTWKEYTIPFRTDSDQTSVLIQLTNKARRSCGNDLAIDDISLRLCNVQLSQSFDLCELPGGSLTIGPNTYTEPGAYLDAFPVPNSCNDTLITTILTGTTRRFPTLRYTFCEGDTLEVTGRRFTADTSFVDTLPGPEPNCLRFQSYEIIAQSFQSFQQNITLCRGDSLRVGNSWYTRAGTYLDTLPTPSGCDSVVITTINKGDIEVELSPSTVEIEEGQSIQLMSSVNFSNSYVLSWQPRDAFSCVDCPDPLLRPPSSGIYRLMVTDLPSGCTDSAAVQVTVLTCEQVFVPNAFSPNGDGINDHLSVFTDNCFSSLLSWHIFDRWGTLVYEIREQSLDTKFLGWDGRINGQLVDQGVYVYQLILERRDGSQKKVQGDFMLLR